MHLLVIADEDEIIVASGTMSSPPIPPADGGKTNAKTSNHRDAPAAKGSSYSAPSGNNDELKNDLLDFGFNQKKVKHLMSKREGKFDSTMQRPFGQLLASPERKREDVNGVRRGSERQVKKVKVSGDVYEPLHLYDDANWVLFDPRRGFPAYPGELPPMFEEYSTFATGNERILEFNVVSESVRLKSTPKALEGKGVEYAKAGPKIVEVVIKRPRGRPRKHPLTNVINGTTSSAAAARLPISAKTKGGPKQVSSLSSEIMGDDSNESSLSDFDTEDDEQGPEIDNSQEDGRFS